MRALRLSLIVIGLAAFTGPAAAQESRAERIRAGIRAAGDFQPQRALQLLTAGVDPALGAIDSLWSAGVQSLVEVLISQRQDSLAALWARWALRQAPNFAIDEVNFLPAVVATFRQAAAAIGSSRERTETTWRWSPMQDLRAPGSVSVVQRAGAPPIELTVVGRGIVPAGESLSLPHGSYVFESRSAGFLPARVTREILPGVETVLSFRLQPANSGFLYVASQPWGIVYVDDERVGYTTLVAHRVAAGQHRIRIQRENFTPVDTVVTVGTDERVRVAVRLQARSR